MPSKRTFIGYKTYNFKTKDPVIDILRIAIKLSNRTYKQISQDSGVSVGALYGWFNGDTKFPRYASVQAVALSLHFEFSMRRHR